MGKKNMLISGIVVFVVYQVLDYLSHEVLMRSTYDATASVWRPRDEMMSLMWVIYVVGLLWSFIFVYIFGWARKGNGIKEGAMYGFCIGLFTVTPMAYNTYAVLPLPYSIALEWFVYGMIKVVICGVVLSLVYKPSPADG